MQLPRLMDSALTEIARVRPVKLSYTLKWAPLSTATLTILKADATVTVGMFAELYDEQGSIGYYIATKVTDGYSGAPTSVITLEHAISTLSDDVVFGYHDYGGTGVSISTVLGQLIALQTTPRWQFGTCDYTTQYQYSFENDNLLTAFLSVAKPIADAYTWDFDFTTTPWTVNLLAASESDASEIRLNRNAESVKIEIDRSNLCTRMYPLGYGEGVNQLTVASVNGGYKYIEDTSAQATWGIVTSVYTDTTVTEATTLKAMAQALLDIRKTPQITITASALDIYTLTGEPFDAFYPGRICRVELPDYGVSVRERVVSITKSDVFGNPTKATLTLSNEVEDAIAVLSNLSRKSAISELYSQGATNQYAVHFADNADASNPAGLSFYVDANAVHINSVVCRYKLEAFRGYSKGAASGGGSTSGGGGASSTTTSSVERTASVTVSTPTDPGDGSSMLYTSSANGAVGMHSHLYSHKHSVVAYVTIPGVTITVPGHTHSTPDHTHAPVLGIYTGATASSVIVKVDGTTVPSGAISGGEFDAVPYLSKDIDGKITRSAWHEITITPDGNTRIVADLHVKTFVRSVSGGIY